MDRCHPTFIDYVNTKLITMDTTENITKKVQNLIVRHIDHHKSFWEAVDHTSNTTLIGFLKKQADEHRKMAMKLTAALVAFNSDASINTEGTVGGALERGWADIRTAFSEEDNAALIEGYAAKINALITQYQETLAPTQKLPENMEATLKEQLQLLEHSLAKIKNL